MYTSILSACFAFQLLLLGHCGGALNILVPEFPVLGIFGEDITLNCSFLTDGNFSLSDLSVIWQLTETKRMVHSYAGQRDQQMDQASSFTNRTSLFHTELQRGNASLLLRQVQIQDEGSFTCFVRINDYNSAPIMLQVAAPYSKPNLYLEPNKNLKPGDRVSISCHAAGGYPQAAVVWQDGRGNNLTANVTTSQVANEEGLFQISSVISVTLEPNSTYTCIVRNQLLNKETQASATITGQHVHFPAVALWLTIGLSICLLGLLGALGYVCRRRIQQSCKEDNAEAEEEEAEARTAMKPLETTEDKEGDEEVIE